MNWTWYMLHMTNCFGCIYGAIYLSTQEEILTNTLGVIGMTVPIILIFTGFYPLIEPILRWLYDYRRRH